MYRLWPDSACPGAGRPGLGGGDGFRKRERHRFRCLRRVQHGLEGLAEWTGLEPATSGVTGQHSNRLNYHSAFWTFSPDRQYD